MTPERFTDWLQGFVEIQQSESITDTQWLIIKDHLKLVFDKKTPDRKEYIVGHDLLARPQDPFKDLNWVTSPVITC